MSNKEFIISLAQKAGDIMLRHFEIGMTKEWKSDHTPVTAADLEINDLVITEISRAFPDHSILGEERSLEMKGAEYVWVCDPVDGTIPFSHGIPTSTFSLALTRDGQVLAGVIYDPFLKRMLFAETGGGALMNDKPVTVSKDATFANSVASVIFRKKNIGYIEIQRKLMEKNASLINLRSFVYTGMLVAAGEVSAVMFTEDMPWDAAALKVIVEEAGGKVTDLDGNDQRYDQKIRGVVVSNGLVHDELIALIAEVKSAP